MRAIKIIGKLIDDRDTRENIQRSSCLNDRVLFIRIRDEWERENLRPINDLISVALTLLLN